MSSDALFLHQNGRGRNSLSALGQLVTNGGRIPVYEMSINLCASLQAQSLSNSGSYGSNRLFGRDQLLIGGRKTQAFSGSILKHHHAIGLAEKMEEEGIPICAACARRDGRRAAALIGRDQKLTIESVAHCGVCDAHGTLVTAKNADSNDEAEPRRACSKHSLLEFSFGLALPEPQAETVHILTRIGDSKEDGQMLMKMPARSGSYAFNIRYKSVGIGVDTDKWRVIITDADQRMRRHQAILSVLRDQILSPSGALTSTMLPHLTGLRGAIVIRERAGRAAIYSALEEDFVERLVALTGAMDWVIPFNSIDEFCATMNLLISSSYPCMPHTNQGGSSSEDGHGAR